MMFRDPLRINDWEFSRFFRIIAIAQIAMWSLLLWNSTDIVATAPRACVGFLFVAYLPGLVALRALGLHNLSRTATSLYSVGLSIFIAMTAGFLLNLTSVAFYTPRPVSAIGFTSTISAITLVLCGFSRFRGKEYLETPPMMRISSSLSLALALSLLLVFWTALGTHLFNAYDINVIQILTLSVLPLVVVFVSFGKYVQANHYSIVIMAVSVSLLFHTSLVTSYVSGWDIQQELFLSTKVVDDGIWDPSLALNANGMLSVVILAPAFSLVCGMPIIWVLKIIYPLIFSLVPVALLCLFRLQMSQRIAFLAVILFVSMPTFIFEMAQLARQEIAELFLVLIAMLILDRRMRSMTRSLLLLCLSFSLVVSHYGVSYFFLGLLLFAWLAERFNLRIGGVNEKPSLNGAYVLFYILALVSWYSYVSSSSSLVSFVGLIERIGNSLGSDLFSPQTTQGLAVIVQQSESSLRIIAKYMHVLIQILIFVGILGLTKEAIRMRFRREYLPFLVYSFSVMIAGLLVPYFASALNTSRLYQIGLLFLAPLFMVGVSIVPRLLTPLGLVLREFHVKTVSLKLSVVILSVYLAFNSGLLYEIADARNAPFTLSQDTDYPRFNEMEVDCAQWLTEVHDGAEVYGDAYRWLLVGSLDWDDARSLPFDLDLPAEGAYVFLGTLNVDTGMVLVSNRSGVISVYEYVESSRVLDGRNLLFDNGGARVFF